MIEKELRKKLTKTEIAIAKYAVKIKESQDEKEKAEAEERLTYYYGKEQGLLEAIKILWGEDYEDKIQERE